MRLIIVLELRSLRLGSTEQPSDRAALLSGRPGAWPSSSGRARGSAAPRLGPSSRGAAPLSAAPVAPPPPRLFPLSLTPSLGSTYFPLTRTSAYPAPVSEFPTLKSARSLCHVRNHIYRLGGGGVLIQSTIQEDSINLLVCSYWQFTHGSDGVRKITL